MTKYIKTKDGKFAGSIGEGKTAVPSTAPLSPTPVEPVFVNTDSSISIEEQYQMFQRHYFSQDGNYGDADALLVVDTTDWTNEDWDEIDEAPDYDRPRIARLISNKYRLDEIEEPDAKPQSTDIDVDADLDVDF